MRSRLDRALEIAVVLAALVTIPLTVAPERGARSLLIVVGDWTVWAVFLAEYSVRLALSRDRRTYVRSNRLSLAIVVLSFPMLPALMGLLRLARLVRLLRLLRIPVVLLRGLKALRLAIGRPGLVYLAAVNVFLILAGGVLLHMVEPEKVKGGVLDGMWLAIVTATTVGYGDIAPVGPWGRAIAVVLMLAGVGLVSTLAASIAAYFIGQDRQVGPERPAGTRQDSVAWDHGAVRAELRRLVEQMDRVEQAVARLAEKPDAERP
ncbi:MAG: ion channel [bacterium]|nr:ion channel [bacterium]